MYKKEGFVMPIWGNVLKEIQGTVTTHPLDLAREKYLKLMHSYTNRNIIAYYSGFLQKNNDAVSIDDNDKNAFMQAVHGLDKSKGLDLILHTPGGSVAAVESLWVYLRSIFGLDIRVFVPQMAMSAGTLLALACKEIVMGKQSSIGPIDPQFGGISCHGVVEEFLRAAEEVSRDPTRINLWRPIIEKYHPTFIGDCQKAVSWADEIARKWLLENMLKDAEDKEERVNRIVTALGDHAVTKSHSRHIHVDECEKMGLKVARLETLPPKEEKGGCHDLQDCVLTIHHTYMLAFTRSAAGKIIENHEGARMVIASENKAF